MPADVHGDLQVLDEVERLDADRVVPNGDIAGGHLPGDTLARLSEPGERAVWCRPKA